MPRPNSGVLLTESPSAARSSGRGEKILGILLASVCLALYSRPTHLLDLFCDGHQQTFSHFSSGGRCILLTAPDKILTLPRVAKILTLQSRRRDRSPNYARTNQDLGRKTASPPAALRLTQSVSIWPLGWEGRSIYPARDFSPPGFLARQLASVCFSVTILGGDTSHQFRKFVRSAGWPQDDAAVCVHRQRYEVAFTEAGLFAIASRIRTARPFRHSEILESFLIYLL